LVKKKKYKRGCDKEKERDKRSYNNTDETIQNIKHKGARGQLYSRNET